MNFFRKLFFKLDTQDVEPIDDEPNFRFGRYSDSFKNDKQIIFWNTAIEKYKSEEYLESYKNFFQYLLDPAEQNVKFEEAEDGIEFEIFQGSKKVFGKATKENLSAFVKLVKINKSNVALMRKLMEKNYQLKHSRFCLDDDIVYLKFSTSTTDGSPEKIYYALREIATQADKNDDILLNEFSAIEKIDTAHIDDFDNDHIAIKLKWLRKFINNALTDSKKLASAANDSDISFILLSTTLKIDYLITPEGKVMDLLEKLLHDYFQVDDQKNLQEKNAEMINIFEDILNYDDEQLSKELYKTKATFGLGNPTIHATLRDFINDYEKIIKKSIKQKKTKIAIYQTEYVLGYILYYNGVYKPTIRYLQFIFKILNIEYFEELGFKNLYFENDKLNEAEISKRTSQINAAFGDEYKNINIDVDLLNYNSLPQFALSFLDAIKNLHYPN